VDGLITAARAALDFYHDSFLMLASTFSEPSLLARHREALGRRNVGPHRAIDGLASYLRKEQELGRVAADANPEASSALLLGACFQHVFLAASSPAAIRRPMSSTRPRPPWSTRCSGRSDRCSLQRLQHAVAVGGSSWCSALLLCTAGYLSVPGSAGAQGSRSSTQRRRPFGGTNSTCRAAAAVAVSSNAAAATAAARSASGFKAATVRSIPGGSGVPGWSSTEVSP